MNKVRVNIEYNMNDPFWSGMCYDTRHKMTTHLVQTVQRGTENLVQRIVKDEVVLEIYTSLRRRGSNAWR